MGDYRTLSYYGGKRGYGKAEWIASFLPHTPDSCYIEPFAGMAGVLLARAPVKTEILNDLNGRVINWWRAVRDEPEEFGRLLEFTPFSRAEYEWGLSAMDDESLPPLRRALAFHVVVDQCIVHGDSSGKASWGANLFAQCRQLFHAWYRYHCRPMAKVALCAAGMPGRLRFA